MIDITYGAAPSEKTAVALGYFDGLHLGHMGVIGAALAQRELKPAVFTFNCDTTLPKFRSPEDLISFENKRELLAKAGVEYIYAPDFAEVCTLTDEDFVKTILSDKLNAGFACCGRNFRFGLGGHGTPKRLVKIGARYGIRTEIVEDVCLDGELISSTHIRELIRMGKIEEANRLLGYEWQFKLPVVHGNELGRMLCFPTINQILPDTNVMPRFGVYQSYVQVHGRNYRGVTNIGVRPTIENSCGIICETHILNFDGDLYGEDIEVALCRFIRPEQRFSSIEELKVQVLKDIDSCKKKG
ncbi:MAG: riboflavin biosynthesis protein RibF [Oscillospiraceae bacterium]|nr:riboflavin biosynthesis protein RibF [Oscillospiraceae bacterium]